MRITKTKFDEPYEYLIEYDADYTFELIDEYPTAPNYMGIRQKGKTDWVPVPMEMGTKQIKQAATWYYNRITTQRTPWSKPGT